MHITTAVHDELHANISLTFDCYRHLFTRGEVVVMSIIHQDPPYENECQQRIAMNPNMLVPWYLMASHAYYYLDRPIISDSLYDKICQNLIDEWHIIEHHHKSYIDFNALPHCSGNYVTRDYMPNRAFWSLNSLLRESSLA